ncbi:MAG TPA: hypothetical protein VJN21_12655 [Candidatus Acidoferrales bacterium]|nr:hypothetical protein [Candidatus Acidoferrales bacterium]
MPVFYKIDKERKLVVTTGSGDVTCQEMLDHQARLANDADFDASFSQFIDTTEPKTIEFTPDCIRRLAKRNLFSSTSRRAILAEKDHLYAHARMFEILREFDGELGIRVFRTREEALEWLTAGDHHIESIN